MKTYHEDLKDNLEIKDLLNSLNTGTTGFFPSINPDRRCSPKKHNILIVDDSVSIVSLVNETLKDHYNIQVAFSGEDALAVMNEYIPDLILLDVVMPGINGYEVCRKVKSDKRFEFVKIIMISGEIQLRDRLKGFEDGADDYIPKPISVMELLAKVKVFLRLKEVEDQLRLMNHDLNKQVKIRSQQLVEAEKLTAIGQHAAGILHNLNTPLQAILGSAELLKMDYPDNKLVETIIRAADSLKDMARTILMSSVKNDNSNMVDIDFNKIITDQIEIMKMDPFFKHKVEKRLNLQTLPLFKGIQSHFIQSLGNLIKNAVEAMWDTQCPVLEISTSSDENSICLIISDNGCGIKKEDMAQIFHPFFTTKPVIADNGRPTGTGLGLASTREMIESYRGRIEVSSKPGVGSIFKVCLPIE